MEFFASWRDAYNIEHHHRGGRRNNRGGRRSHHVDWKKLAYERKETFAHMTKEDKAKFQKTVPMLKKMWADCMKKTKGDKKRCKEMEFFASWKDAADIEKADHHHHHVHHDFTAEQWKKMIAERKATFAHMTKEDKMKYAKTVPMLKKMW